ncbi:hypothetical protein COU54_00200 [Candidatus Pacearchaeota archaeon CG10_big_fil_rev_8_21_14_0_10_31_24]|nr:MAG: hypothetical protein COU54_00200 [Candidatus Pacearchaeota archaeon CG10_big_fil_rev_8_21_14_0_10_31_24]
MIIYKNKKKINLKVRKVSLFGKFSGLMFRTNNTSNLLFEFSMSSNPIFHSWFVFFPFLIVWLDEKNNVQEVKLVNPFTTMIQSKEHCKKLIEIPLNKKNSSLVHLLVGKERFK